jgi:hypothetical protein
MLSMDSPKKGERLVNTKIKQCPECGETILAIAKKCKHCQADLIGAASNRGRAERQADLGFGLLGLPVAAALLAWFWVGSMNLLQSPESSLALIVVATVCGTAILAAMEAAKAGAISDRSQGTYSPISWFFIVALLWIVGYPAYLLKRSRYGLKNYLVGGLAVMLMFAGTVGVMEYSIQSQVSEVRAKLEDMQKDVATATANYQQALSGSANVSVGAGVQIKVTELLNEMAIVKTSVAEYYAINGSMPESCAQIGQCPTTVSVVSGGRIAGRFDAADSQEVAGKSIMLTPSIDAKTKDIIYTCSSNVQFRYLPSACRNALAQTPVPTVAAAPEAGTAPEPMTATEPTRPPTAPVGGQLLQSNTDPLVKSPVEASDKHDAPPNPSFDCVRASSVVEKLICSNPDLATADSGLAAFYQKNIAAGGTNAATIKRGQREFIATRNQCGTVACVAEAYRARYEELAIMGYVKE